MNFPAELKYSKSHEWVRMDGEIAVVGISDFAQDALGDVVFINLPAEGDAVTAGESFGDVESVKAVSDIISPSAAPSARSTRRWPTRPKRSTPIPTARGSSRSRASAAPRSCSTRRLMRRIAPRRADGLLCSDHRGGTGGNACCHRGQKPWRTCIRRSRRRCC